MQMYEYDRSFFDSLEAGSLASARAVVPLAQAYLRPTSVLDVGCGCGAWVSVWQDAGLHDVVGVDGAYVDADRLLFDAGRFRAADIAQPFRLGRGFSLAQCLEVAEHLPADAANTLVDNLAAHAPMVLFSAAQPGQGGENHVNEQPPEYWRQLFDARGFELFDFFRPRLAGRRTIEPWYRYNLLLFVRRDAVSALPLAVEASRVPHELPVADVSPVGYRLRKWLLAHLSPATVTQIARTKHRLVLATAPAREERAS